MTPDPLLTRIDQLMWAPLPEGAALSPEVAQLVATLAQQPGVDGVKAIGQTQEPQHVAQVG